MGGVVSFRDPLYPCGRTRPERQVAEVVLGSQRVSPRAPDVDEVHCRCPRYDALRGFYLEHGMAVLERATVEEDGPWLTPSHLCARLPRRRRSRSGNISGRSLSSLAS